MRNPSFTSTVVLLCGLVAAGGCANEADDEGVSSYGGGETTDEPDDEPDDDDEPSDPPPQEPPPSQEQDGCSITYQNAIYDGGEVTIFYIFLFPTGADDPGPDLLGTTGVLPYGYQLEVVDIPFGTYDTIVVDEDDYFYVATEIDCDGNEWTWEITAADAAGQLEP
jgi:hypothetical protein